MMKTRKRVFGFVLAGLMFCLPSLQVLAQTYDAAMMDPAPVLFPGDTLTGIAAPLTLDGEQVLPGEEIPASWTNQDESKVYLAVSGEDGSVQLSLAGYELTVTGGTSSAGDETTGPVGGHYVSTEEERPEEDMPKKDRAYYPAYTVVKLKADEPEEGMEFDKWTVESGDVVLEDELSGETTVTMPENKVEITASYRPVQPDVPEEQGVEGSPEGQIDPNMGVIPDESQPAPDEGIAADNTMIPDTEAVQETQADPDMSAAPEVQIDPGMDVTPEVQIDPGMDAAPEVQIDPGMDVTPEVQIDPDMSITPEVQTDPEMSDMPETPEIPESEGAADPNGGIADTGAAEGPDDSIMSGIDESAIDVMMGDDYSDLPEVNPAANGDGAEVPESDSAIRYMLSVNYGTVTAENAEDPGDEKGYPAGTLLTVKANDYTEKGYTFAGWTAGPQNVELELADSSSETITFQMPQGDIILTAGYVDASGIPVADPAAEPPATPQTGDPSGSETSEPVLYNIVITTADGTEGGTATVDGVSAASAAAGASVTVTAADKTAEGKRFTGWQVSSADAAFTRDSLSADQNNPLTATFTMPGADVTLTAEYEPILYKVSMMADSWIRSADGTTLTDGSYAAGTTIQVEASTPSGMQFAGWIANPSGTFADASQLNTTFTVPSADVSITAQFVPVMYTVKVSNGLVNGQQQLSVASGTTVTITANANPAGQTFSMWNVTEGAYDLGENKYNSSIMVTVNQNLSFAAAYQGLEYQIAVNDGAADYKKAVSGTVITVTADDAPKGMEFDYWSVDTGNASLQNAYSEITTFTMPAANVTVSANYRTVQYYVTVQNGYSDVEACYEGDKVTVHSNYPANGREFDQWKAVDGSVSFADASRAATSFTMPAEDVTVSATYKDGPSPENNQILDLVAGGEYITDSTIRFTAVGAGMDNTNPNPGDYRYRPTGYQIGNVTGSWDSSPYTTSMSIKARGEYTLKVNYAKEVFDGNNWVSDGTSDTRTVTFRVLTPAEAVATGDETPIALVAAIAGASCLLFLLLLVVFIRRKKNHR